MIRKFFLLFFTILLISCDGNTLSKNDVELLMMVYFEKIKQNDFCLVESYYSNDFYNNTSREKWEEFYDKLHSILGSVISVELTSWSVKAELKTSGSENILHG